ncbi:hypothetical protein BC826DRAFT_1022204, partial [Russula brevipes]
MIFTVIPIISTGGHPHQQRSPSLVRIPGRYPPQGSQRKHTGRSQSGRAIVSISH